MLNTLKRLNSDQILGLAIAFSVALHLMILAVIFLQPDTQQQSSFGQGHVILLEHVADQPTKVTEQTIDTQAASQKSDLAQTSGINGKHAKPVESIAQQTLHINSPHTQTRKAKSTSNQGSLIDQSGKEQTPQERYRQLVTSHLLKKAKSAPTSGQVVVHLNILKIGIATRVDVQLIEGPNSYKQWVNRQVLSSNPFPAFPNGIKKTSIKLAISISHQTE